MMFPADVDTIEFRSLVCYLMLSVVHSRRCFASDVLVSVEDHRTRLVSAGESSRSLFASILVSVLRVLFPEGELVRKRDHLF